MSTASATRVNLVQLTVSPEAAAVIRELVYWLNWGEFLFAEDVVTAIDDLTLEFEGSVEYNADSKEFDRA